MMDIRERRKIVQDKILAIHEKIYSKIKKLDVYCHWNPNHITSLINPCVYNKGKVSWLGIRYGKSKKEVDIVNQYLDNNEKDEIKGFQKHGCLQFCIVPYGFEINLFLAVRHDAIDRAYVQEKMQQLKPKITKLQRWISAQPTKPYASKRLSAYPPIAELFAAAKPIKIII